MTADHDLPSAGPRNVTVRSFNDIAGYEHSMRLATTSMVVREAPNFNGWHAKIDLGRVRFNSAEYSASLSTRSTVRWPRFFFLTGSGRPARVSGPAFDHGVINFMAEHGDVSMISNKHMAWTSIEFAPDLLTTDFEALSGLSGSRLDHGAMFVAGGTVAWKRLMDLCRATLRLGMTDATGFDASPAATAAGGALIDAALACLPTEAPEVERAATGRHHVILRRMIGAIEGDGRAELTMASLCHATNVSARTLHEVSMCYLGMPPGRFLRNHRLRMAHETLRDAAPGSITVTTAMARNGIWETARATSVYRVIFGQPPEDTLNKVPRSAVVGSRSARISRMWV